MKIRSLVSAGLALALSALLVGAGFPSSARASTIDPVSSVSPAVLPSDLAGDLAARELSKLENYRVMVTAEQLTAAGGTTERGAWSAQKGAMAAADVDRYNIRSTVGLEKGMGQLDTIRPWGVGDKLNANWYNKIKLPRYTGLGLAKPTSLLLLPATIGWEYRGSITDGVLNFAQMSSKDSLVCEQKYVDGVAAGFVNWLTDVDCDAWAVKDEFVPNAGVIAGFTSGLACSPDGVRCIRVTGSSTALKNTPSSWTTTDGYQVPVICYGGGTGGAVVPTYLKLASGFVQPMDGYSSPDRNKTWWAVGSAAPWPCDGSGWPNGDGHTVPIDSIVGISMQATQALAMSQPITPVVAADMNPPRTRVCEQTGSNGQIYTASTDQFTDSQVATDGYPAFACAPLPLGVSSDRLRLMERSAGQPDKILADQQADATPQTDALLGGNAVQYCQTNVCVLDLVIKSSGVTCFSQGETCNGWWDEANHGDTKYQCNYAGHNIAIGECALYSKIFDTQKRYAGNPYSDPVTGEEVGRQTGTSIDGLMMSGIPRASFSGRDCFGAGFGSANPLQWVLRPLQCFGEWAAVPRQSVVQVAQLNNTAAYDGKVVKVLPAILASWKFFPPSNGCSGIPVDVWFLGPPFNVMGACSGSMLAPMAFWARLFSALSITVLGVLALTRYAGKTFGYTGLGSGSDS